MTHVVTEACIRCKYTDCVDVCPVDCFREGPNFLVIDPDECIDCAVCIPECPVNAIVPEEDVPGNQQQYIQINADLAKKWPSITKRKEALPDADEWKDKTGKLDQLIRETEGVVVRTCFCGMPKYNELMGRPHANLNRLLAWQHATALEQALAVFPLLQAPAGRMQRIGGNDAPLVIVDSTTPGTMTLDGVTANGVAVTIDSEVR